MIDLVTHRYAGALFHLASTQGVLDAVRADVVRLAPDFEVSGALAFVFDERLALDARRKRVQERLKGMHALTQNFVNLLFDKRRVEVLHGLGAAFHQRTLEQRGQAEGVVESARPLGPGELAELATALGPRLGKELLLKNRIHPELVGGLRVVVESKMLDASLQGSLEGLRKHLLAAPLPLLPET